MGSSTNGNVERWKSQGQSQQVDLYWREVGSQGVEREFSSMLGRHTGARGGQRGFGEDVADSDVWNKQFGGSDKESRDLNTYDVELHNGTHGLGLMLSECKVKDKTYVVVAGFAKLPEGVKNNAKESSVILKADALTHINGTDVSDMAFNDIITILRQLPRGSGIAGSMVKLKFRILEEEIVRKVYAYFEKARKAKKAKRSSAKISSDKQKENTSVQSAEKRRKLWKS